MTASNRQVPVHRPGLPTVRLFGFDIARADLAQVVAHLVDLAQRDRPSYVVTMNVDHVVDLARSQRFRTAYDRAAVRVADGAPIVAVARLAGRAIPARVAGADLLEPLCREAAARGLRVAIIGGAHDVNGVAVANLRTAHPGLDITGWAPFGFDTDESVSLDIARRLRELAPRIVFVCFGAPRSEIWLSEHLDLLPPGLAVCAGAAVDFAAGTRRRAPAWVQSTGLEWLYRLVQEPGRLWRRYLVRDLAFAPIAAREIAKASAERYRAARSRRRNPPGG